jgi:3-keto-5-aminohexanoate cleavage enzyme
MTLGGNVRVGFEDNIYIRYGELAKSNADLVKRIVTISEALNIEVAKPDEARKILGLPKP